jgi:hypothetical protein
MIVPSQAVVDRRIEELPEEIKEGNELIDLNKTFTRVVYRVIDGKTVATPVSVGPSDLTQTVITEGLSKDDMIVSGPFRVLVDLKHDKAVRDQNEKPEEDADKQSAENTDDDGADTEQPASPEAGSDDEQTVSDSSGEQP